jgi:hypothetical protein
MERGGHEEARAWRPPPIARGDTERERKREQQQRHDAARTHQVPDRERVRGHEPPDCATGAWYDRVGADDNGASIEPSSELSSELELLEEVEDDEEDEAGVDERCVCSAASPATAPVTATEPARRQRVTARTRRSSSARLCV